MNGMQWPNFDLDFMVVLCEFLSILTKVHLFFSLAFVEGHYTHEV